MLLTPNYFSHEYLRKQLKKYLIRLQQINEKIYAYWYIQKLLITGDKDNVEEITNRHANVWTDGQ